MGRTFSIYEKPVVYRRYGGGGNRTRVAGNTENPLVQDFLCRVYSDGDNIFQLETTSLYCIEEEDGPLKIGVGRDPQNRIKTLQQGNPRRLRLLFACPATSRLERVVHRALRDDCVTGEWFEPTDRVFGLLGVFISVSEICSDINEHDLGPADADDTRAILEGFARRALFESVWTPTRENLCDPKPERSRS